MNPDGRIPTLRCGSDEPPCEWTKCSRPVSREPGWIPGIRTTSMLWDGIRATPPLADRKDDPGHQKPDAPLHGKLAERSKAAVLKTADAKASVGSIPTLPANAQVVTERRGALTRTCRSRVCGFLVIQQAVTNEIAGGRPGECLHSITAMRLICNQVIRVRFTLKAPLWRCWKVSPSFPSPFNYFLPKSNSLHSQRRHIPFNKTPRL